MQHLVPVPTTLLPVQLPVGTYLGRKQMTAHVLWVSATTHMGHNRNPTSWLQAGTGCTVRGIWKWTSRLKTSFLSAFQTELKNVHTLKMNHRLKCKLIKFQNKTEEKTSEILVNELFFFSLDMTLTAWHNKHQIDTLDFVQTKTRSLWKTKYKNTNPIRHRWGSNKNWT